MYTTYVCSFHRGVFGVTGPVYLMWKVDQGRSPKGKALIMLSISSALRNMAVAIRSPVSSTFAAASILNSSLRLLADVLAILKCQCVNLKCGRLSNGHQSTWSSSGRAGVLGSRKMPFSSHGRAEIQLQLGQTNINNRMN